MTHAHTPTHTPGPAWANNLSRVFWPERKILLIVVGAKIGRNGEERLVVCKSTAPNSDYVFSVQRSEVELVI